jgi:hypothetical protein
MEFYDFQIRAWTIDQERAESWYTAHQLARCNGP